MNVEQVECSRCHKRMPKHENAEFTGGYYKVAPGDYWSRFTNPGEVRVCDACMWADPRYLAVYRLGGA